MEMDLDKEILKSQRDRRAWSQTQLAEVSGLSLRTIQRIEKTGVASQESTKSLAVSMSVLLLNS
jgi:DNA-binding XRE family transcriptional regulator